MRDFSGHEQHGRSILANRHTSAARNAGGSVHCEVSGRFRHGYRITVRRAAGIDGDEAARLDDSIKCATIRDKIFDQRKSFRSPWLDRDGVAILKTAHVQLAGGCPALSTVRNAVDDEGAHAADALAAI